MSFYVEKIESNLNTQKALLIISLDTLQFTGIPDIYIGPYLENFGLQNHILYMRPRKISLCVLKLMSSSYRGNVIVSY